MADVTLSLASASKHFQQRTGNLRYTWAVLMTAASTFDLILPENATLMALECESSVGVKIVAASFPWTETAQVISTVFPYTRTSGKITVTPGAGGIPAGSFLVATVVM